MDYNAKYFCNIFCPEEVGLIRHITLQWFFLNLLNPLLIFWGDFGFFFSISTLKYINGHYTHTYSQHQIRHTHKTTPMLGYTLRALGLLWKATGSLCDNGQGWSGDMHSQRRYTWSGKTPKSYPWEDGWHESVNKGLHRSEYQKEGCVFLYFLFARDCLCHSPCVSCRVGIAPTHPHRA